jgi:DNA ligase-1
MPPVSANPFNITVLPRDGVFLPQWEFWLDPHRPKKHAFVSHAHSDHTALHDRTLATPQTLALMERRMGNLGPTEPLPYRQWQVRRAKPGRGPDARVCLLPAGHVLGSAQFFLENAEGESLLYTGDFKLREGDSSEAIEWRHADTLIMETTFGRPQYRFPPAKEVLARVVEFCEEALEEGQTPVLLGYALGKAQEILVRLREAGLPTMLHRSVAEMTRLYEDMGVQFPPWEPFSEKELAGKVLICPPSANRSRMLRRIKQKRVAMLSGWALDKNAVYRYQVDACFPLSDHADYEDLIKYVELVNPRRVLTLHGFAADFARDLRQRGIEAWSLTQSDQLELALPGDPAVTVQGADLDREEAPAVDAGPAEAFRNFARVCREVVATPSKLKKVEALSAYLRDLAPDDAALAQATVFLTGQPYAQATAKPLNAGWAILRAALKSVSGQPETEVRRISRSEMDAGRAAYLLLQPRRQPSTDVSLREVAAAFDRIREARGPVAKQAVLEELLRRLDANEAEFVIRIMTGDLRIGLKEGLLEESVASAFSADLGELKEANMLLGDIGAAALLARDDRLGEARPRLFHPISCMLASPGTEAEQLWERAVKQQDRDRPELWLQEKYDGIRAQLHVGWDAGRLRAAIFSRDSRDITEQFTDVSAAALKLQEDVILDGEILAYEEGRFLRFFDLQKRLGRREPDLFMQAEVPIVYMVFDLLWIDGVSLLKQPLRERLRRLGELQLPPGLRLAPMRVARSVGEVETAFEDSRKAGHEGLVMKDPDSVYSPGRRGLAWMKFKKHLETLDVVVVAVEQGHGKRSHVLSDYTFAVRDEATDELRVLGKSFTGLTDEEIEDMTEFFKGITLSEKRGRHVVQPQVVLEVAFDSIQPSKRHDSGLALRFPRIKQIRKDKTVRQIDTLQRARAMAAEQALNQEPPQKEMNLE